MNKYYIDLNFDIPLFLDTVIIDRLKNPETSYQSKNPSFINRGQLTRSEFNPKLIAWLEAKGLSHVASDFFYRTPWDVDQIHTDGLPRDVGKLNWVFGQDDQNSKMFWYSMKKDRPSQVGNTSFGTPWATFDEEDLILEESAVIKGTPTLVNIGVPHTIKNGSLARLCITMHLRDHLTGEQPTWARCIELFQSEISQQD